MEIIRFAAANRLTVEIDYVKENGEHTTREIEADEKSSASDQLLGRLAKMKPEPRNKSRK